MADGFEPSDQDTARIGVYWACAKAFGYTPKMVDETDAVVINGMLILEKIKNEKEVEATKRATRK